MLELDPTLPAELGPLQWLIGTWEGTGVLSFPLGERTVEQEFAQRVSFAHEGHPSLSYEASAWKLDEATGLPLHVGNPIAEQRRLRAGSLVLLPRDVLRLSGPDTLPWLDSITSQAVDALPAGASTESLVLSPEGRIEHAMRLRWTGDELWIIVDAGTGDALETWLTRMRFYKQVEISRPDVVVVGTAGEPAAEPSELVSMRAFWPPMSMT